MSKEELKEALLQELFPSKEDFNTEYRWTDADEIGRGAFGKVYKAFKVST